MRPRGATGGSALALALALAACGRLGFDAVDGVPGIPVITEFSVSNGLPGSGFETRSYLRGDRVVIRWTVVGPQLLADGPIDLYVTTDGSTWTPVVQRFGGLTGNPSRYTFTYAGFAAPSDGWFRLKLVATDRLGETSVPALSDVQNAGSWSVYLGSTDRGIGGAGRSVNLEGGDRNLPFAIDPVRGDVYALDAGVGLVRMDATTGRTSLFVGRGTSNFVDDGPLPEPLTNDVDVVPVFDRAGRLYLSQNAWQHERARIYQIDLSTRRMRLYVGPAETAMASGIAFDERDALYFLSSCTPDTWTAASAARIMKLAQAPDGSPGAVTPVAGNCVSAPPTLPGPVDALSSALTDSYWPQVSSIAAWNNGAVVVFAHDGAAVKILDGRLYSSSVICDSGSISYDAATGRLYCADGSITAYLLNLAGADGDTAEVVVPATGSAGCHQDGVQVAAACADAYQNVVADRDGRILFADGAATNHNRSYRVRAIDTAGVVSTVMGTLPFVGDGVDANLARGTFAGIYYKPTTAPAQQAFPAGLYFLERGGPVLGYVEPQRHVVSRLWGDQTVGTTAPLETGPRIGPDVPFGNSRFTNGFPLTFDDDGLPWLQYSFWLSKLDGAGFVPLQTGAYDQTWEAAADGDDPRAYSSWVYGLYQGLTLKGQGAFFIGAYDSGSPRSAIWYFDFAAQTVLKVMGAGSGGSSPDTAIPGSVKTRRLDSFCSSLAPCHVRYLASEDRLYFGEARLVRYIDAPTDPARSTLTTLFTAPDVVGDFMFSLDERQVFYVMGGRLYCHDRSSGASWCNDTVLGPPAPMSPIVNAPNQLTWIDPQHLLVSTGAGEIYLYRTP